jgi:hypothetical protein
VQPIADDEMVIPTEASKEFASSSTTAPTPTPTTVATPTPQALSPNMLAQHNMTTSASNSAPTFNSNPGSALSVATVPGVAIQAPVLALSPPAAVVSTIHHPQAQAQVHAIVGSAGLSAALHPNNNNSNNNLQQQQLVTSATGFPLRHNPMQIIPLEAVQDRVFISEW